MITVSRYTPEYRPAVLNVLTRIGWDELAIRGQLGAIDAHADDEARYGVFVAATPDAFAGFVWVQFYDWNRLAQVHGLAVDPDLRRQKIAATLMNNAEEFARQKGARGVYVDTPVTNTIARHFYVAQGYLQDYLMTAYYDDDLDGVTYLKLFNRVGQRDSVIQRTERHDQ
jgi:ribosomal protein S18 acetylase RimI-like enzyme